MSKFELKSSFNPIACLDCSVRETCEAGRIIDEVDHEITSEAIGVLRSSEDNIIGPVSEGNDSTIGIDKLGSDMEKVAKRAGDTWDVVGNGLRQAVAAENCWASKQIELDQKTDALNGAMDTIALSPITVPAFLDDEIEDRLTKASGDVVSYANSGICGAVEIEFI